MPCQEYQGCRLIRSNELRPVKNPGLRCYADSVITCHRVLAYADELLWHCSDRGY